MDSDTAWAAPLTVFDTRVQQDWVDYNGHMRDAYFGLVFSYAVDALMERLGLDEAYRTATGGTLYVVEAHQYYLKEAREDEPLRVEAQLLDADGKRLHLLLDLCQGTSGDRLALQESLLLHVDQSGDPKVTPFPAAILATVEAMKASHAALEAPALRSRAIAIVQR